MNHDKFDVYRLAIEDTNQINGRRQAVDSLFTTIITLILSGDVSVGLLSRFDNWLVVAVTGGVGIVGIIIVARWNQARRELDDILKVRYAFLQEREKDPELAGIGSEFITEEYNTIYHKREVTGYRSATRRLASNEAASQDLCGRLHRHPSHPWCAYVHASQPACHTEFALVA